MLMTNIALYPYGDSSKCEVVGGIAIANIVEHKPVLITHDKTVYYDYMFAFADSRWGIVRRHDRRQDVYSLMKRVFEAKLYDDMPDDEQLIGILTKLKNCF